MKRVRGLMLVVLLTLSGAQVATAHTLPNSARCPCIILAGEGSRSATFDAPAAFDVFQADLQPAGDSSELSGWAVQDMSGRVVAARIYLARGTVFSHSVGEASKARLPKGRYVITRLTRSKHRFLIPVRGISSRTIEPRQVAAIVPTYAVQTNAEAAYGLKTLTGALPLSRKAKLLFVEVSQSRSSRLDVLHCLDDEHCSLQSREPTSEYPYASSVVVSVRLDGDHSRSRVVASGAGEEMWALQMALSSP